MRLRQLLTRLLTVALSTALLAGVTPAPGSLPEAAAVKRTKTYSSADADSLSKAKKAQLKVLDKMWQRSIKKGSTRVDYRKLDKYDAGHTTWRRESAAGWIMAGGTISNISSAERKKVYAKIPGPNRCQICVSPASAGKDKVTAQRPDPGTKGCTGSNKKNIRYKGLRPVIPYSWIDADLYFNSCETDLIIRHLGAMAVSAGITLAILAASGKGVGQGLTTAVVGGLITLSAVEVDYRQRRSNVDAVWVRVRYDFYIQLRSQ